MNRFCQAIAAFAALSIGTASFARAADAASAVETKTGQNVEKFEKGDVKLDYLLYLPADYAKADKKWPLIFFLHGSGESGSDVLKVKVHGPPKVVEKEPDGPLATQFVVVSPQCPNARQGWKADDLTALLDDIQAKYKIDADRVYLTGLSMGGFGTWRLAAKSPERFAAIAPMCGGGDPTKVEKLKALPIWVFHGEADPTVPVKRSEEMVDALKAAGADVKFTKYPGVGHDCWTQSYANHDLYAFFLSHKRGDKPAAASTAK